MSSIEDTMKAIKELMNYSKQPHLKTSLKQKKRTGGSLTKDLLGNDNNVAFDLLGDDKIIEFKKNKIDEEKRYIKAIEHDDEIELIYFKSNKTRTDTKYNNEQIPELDYYVLTKRIWNDDRNWIPLRDFPDYEIFWNHVYPSYYDNQDEIEKRYSELNNYPNLIRDKNTKELIMETIHSGGYIEVCLPKNTDTNGKELPRMKHQIMGRQFIKRPKTKSNKREDQYTIVDHIDHDVWSNRLNNLRWTTHRENMQNKGNSSRGTIDVIDVNELPNDYIEVDKYNAKDRMYEFDSYVYSHSTDRSYKYQYITDSNSYQFSIINWNRNNNSVSLRPTNPKDSKNPHTTLSRKKSYEQHDLN